MTGSNANRPTVIVLKDKKGRGFLIEEYGPDLKRPGVALVSLGERPAFGAEEFHQRAWAVLKNSLLSFSDRARPPVPSGQSGAIATKLRRTYHEVSVVLESPERLRIFPVRYTGGRPEVLEERMLDGPFDDRAVSSAIDAAFSLLERGNG